MITEPDRRAVVGPYCIDLWKGFFRDEVRIWKSVQPALGGLIGRQTVWHWQSEALYKKTVTQVRELLAEQSLVEDQ